MERGVGPLGRVYVLDIVPATLNASNIAASQTATTLTLTAGAGVTAASDGLGTVRYRLDTPRNVTITSAGNASNASFTVRGFDAYGQALTQTLTGPNATTVQTTKAFASVISVTATTTPGAAVTVGTGDRFGLPVRVTDAGYVATVKWAGVLAQDAGTLTAADGTTATASTGDVRGTYQPSSASNGTRRLVMCVAVPALACGPNATRLGAFGVPQF
jgi:VCBS repeat-containing protein